MPGPLEREVGLRFTFVNGLEVAVGQARIAAGAGHVVTMGGGTPLLRAGTRQGYRQRHVRPSSNAVPLVYKRLLSSDP